MTPHPPYHFGRQWIGHEVEDACPCPAADCGLIVEALPGCEQHAPAAWRTMRQAHPAAACPGRHDLVEVEGVGGSTAGACTCGEQYADAPRHGRRALVEAHLEHLATIRKVARAQARRAAIARRAADA